MKEQGCWKWLSVSQMLASPNLAPDLRRFLSRLDPALTLDAVERELHDFQSQGKGMVALEVVALGVVVAGMGVVNNLLPGPLLKGAMLLAGISQMPPLVKEQLHHWRLRLAPADLALRLREAAEQVGPPWVEIFADGGKVDRRFHLSDHLPRRELHRDPQGALVRHEWDFLVAGQTLHFVAGPEEVVVSGPRGESCAFSHQGIVHSASSILIRRPGQNLWIHLDGHLSLGWCEESDYCSPLQWRHDTVRLPSGSWTYNCGGPCSQPKTPVRIEENCFDYGDFRLECPLPLRWLQAPAGAP